MPTIQKLNQGLQTVYNCNKKEGKQQPTDRVTLKDTGEFHRSIFVKFTKDTIIIDSDNDLRDKLVEKYGAAIFGLTKQNKQALIRIIETIESMGY